MTDKLREAAQQAEREAFEAWVAKVQPAYWRVEAWQTEAWAMWQSISAAIAQQDAQAVPQPSPTAGMNIAQRILHVGGRNNAAGYVEFGSIQAVEALVRQVIRDLPELVELENLRHNVKVYREATALTLNAAPTPPARATLTASEILNMTPESIPAEHDGALLEYARAVIEAYERKNGKEAP